MLTDALNGEPEAVRPPEARYPFDDLDADIVLRSSDGVSFRVYRKVLAKASPVFRDMFTLPVAQTQGHGTHPGPTAQDQVPVVSLSESTQTLEDLLRMCYPVDQPEFVRLEEVHAVLEATRKYMMDAIARRVKRHLMSFAKDEPLRVFLLACAFNFKDEARQAAKLTLHIQMRPLPPKPAELHLVPSPVLYGLLEYHDGCADAAYRVLTNLSWALTEVPGRGVSEAGFGQHRHIVRAPLLWSWFRCAECPAHSETVDVRIEGLNERLTPRSWWMEYIRRVKDALAKQPVGSLALELKMMEPSLRYAAKCYTCGPLAFEELCDFSRHLAERIDKATAAVPLSL